MEHRFGDYYVEGMFILLTSQDNRKHFQVLMIVFAGSQISSGSGEFLSTILITYPTSNFKTVRFVNAGDDVKQSRSNAIILRHLSGTRPTIVQDYCV